ncbi:MAG: bifunctional DNA-formamidopyrimidine glycosylase/DNA-(apurinic or apyrimidinic site) lyase, partial [Actinobacteria bacterium]|nr:bifunctional DNA-formamidopyrimidine glycosylase/DNA-(apurinic or apyrimidinic site) lyase [Actinomycetota bacterium]
MPELPEVETIVRRLAPVLAEVRIRALDVRDARWCAPVHPDEVAGAVAGRRIERLWRRGKYLVLGLDEDIHLVMHLRMTGTLLWEPESLPAHTRVVLDVGTGRLAFVDPRRFGTGTLVLGTPALDAFFAARLGVEPLEEEFTPAHLRGLARGRRAPIKAFLLDQRNLAGVGNIYADEALFRARVHPQRPAGALRPGQYGLLRDAVVEVLRAGIEARGASIDDYRDPDGTRGSFQDRFLVHRREGRPCPVCGRTVRKLVVAGRGTYVCEGCQPRPRVRRSRSGGGEKLVEAPGVGGGDDLGVAADQLATDDDLGEGHHPGALDQLGTS